LLIIATLYYKGYVQLNKQTVLIVDDSILICGIVKSMLQENDDIEVVSAGNGSEALELADKLTPDLILLDIVLPNISGYEVCTRLKANPKTANIPIIFITSKSEDDDILKGFELGAVDYVQKPFRKLELKSRVLTHLEIKQTRDKLIKTNEELKIAMERLNLLAVLDPLTGLYNRRFFLTRLSEEIKRSSRTGSEFSLIMCDIDYFKKINDTYGHEAGDKALVSFSKTLSGTCRATDIIARWGGEEFLILAPETDEKASAVLAEKLRTAVENSIVKYNDLSFSFTITLGVGGFDLTKTAEQNISLVDAALYNGKYSGRNKVVCCNNFCMVK